MLESHLNADVLTHIQIHTHSYGTSVRSASVVKVASFCASVRTSFHYATICAFVHPFVRHSITWRKFLGLVNKANQLLSLQLHWIRTLSLGKELHCILGLPIPNSILYILVTEEISSY